MRRMNKTIYAYLISALVAVAVLATLARLVYYTIHWRDFVSAAAELSWLEWSVVALFVLLLIWQARRAATANRK